MVLRLALFFLALQTSVAATAMDTLLDVYGLALENDPNINIARLRVEGGEAGSQIARGSLLPQVTASGQWTDNQVAFDDAQGTRQNFPGERRNIQLRQMLFNWQSISASRRASRVVDQRENELLEALGQLSIDVSERYLNVLLADRNVELLQAEKTLVEEQLEEATALYERKLARITDLLETRARVDTVRTELIDAENEAALAREEITALTGTGVAALADVRESAELPPLSGDIKTWEARAVSDNALLLSKQDAIEASRMSVEEQRGGHLPTADLVLSYQEADVGFDNLQSPPREVEYIGIEVSIPLFRGGATRGRMREAWSNYYIAQEEETAVRREVLKRVRSAWLTTTAAKRRVEASKLSVESANTSYEAMRKARGLGSATSAAVLEALHNRTRAQRDYWQAVYGYLFNWLSLQREAGALDADVLQQLDVLLSQ
ncbi:TolC family outer membrane protein [Chromatocurvus halotolerans]|uniref:Outer membrane protein n=1 Tax=Chromatocurvus halotolerans TaxID=1132028 RepID=A0A4R2KMH0_9GAMM|nr:TolC family outer membrane protein [Chromatocurvus halotolerans]TCO73747.1 outer membrane protein [Chromatocurvus halotolerans]